MKGDLSRETFDPKKRYNSVRMQQGRVLLDADWNEQTEITRRRIETEAADLIGGCGAPMWNDGFRIVAEAAGLSADEAARPVNASPPALQGGGDFLITGGRIYVDGVLCENYRIMSFARQDDLPGVEPVEQAGLYIAYLDVWTRHVTALEDPAVRETALGGPDTTTRGRTTRQVKLLRVGDEGTIGNCAASFPEWEELTAPPDGKLTARAEPDETSKDPCIVAAGAGYRRLENQLYRVEVHRAGPRGTATFKWSRENGSVVARWESQDATGEYLTLGSDAVGKFSSGDWVELIDETRTLQGVPGTLVRLSTVEGRTIRLDLTTVQGGGSTDIADFPLSPVVRRWDNTDSDAVLRPTNSDWIGLEDGVQVRFSAGEYRTGDYWLIPARTVTADVEWPADGGGTPLAQLPRGIEHDYCRLALMRFDGTEWTEISDCRPLFPPVTELTSFFYLGGDGQQAMPDPSAPGAFLTLDVPLRVGVANGEHPVAGARVQFTVVQGGGELNGGGASVIVTTNSEGVAACSFRLDSVTEVQIAEARLLKPDNTTAHLPVRFAATLSLASRVAYVPGACDRLAGTKTVQEALDALCALNSAGCSIPISPGDNWREILALLINDHARLNICFEPGDYHLNEPIRFSGKESVSIHGAGEGTRFLGTISESVFVFECCRSVTLHDFYAEVDGGEEGIKAQSSLAGVVTAIDCGKVSMERLALKSAGGAIREMTCVTVRNGLPEESKCDMQSSIRIRGCDLRVGHQQTGILLVNGERITVEDNRLQGEGRPTVAGMNERLKKDPQFRRAMSRRILNVLSMEPVTGGVRGEQPAGGLTPGRNALSSRTKKRSIDENAAGRLPGGTLSADLERSFGHTSFSLITFRTRGFEITAETPTPLAAMWGPLFDKELARQIASVRELGTEMARVTDELLTGKIEGALARPYDAWLREGNEVLPAVALQGIVVGGTTAPEVRIRGNSIESVRQGIHIGMSHREAPPGKQLYDRAGIIGVADNSVVVVLSSEMRGERHGIFAGNCDSLLIEGNYVRVLRDTGSDNLGVEGIRVYGYLGPRMIARGNLLEGVRTGVRVVPLNNEDGRQWLVADTMAYPAQPVDAPGTVQQINNK